MLGPRIAVSWEVPVGRANVVIGIVVIGVFVLALAWSALGPDPEPAAYPYSQLIADAAAGRVSSIVQQGTELTVKLRGVAATRTSSVASDRSTSTPRHARQRGRSWLSVRSATRPGYPVRPEGS